VPALNRRSVIGSAALPNRATARFLWTPTDLILNHRSRPEVAALYAALARLCEIARGPVEVSRTDLAHWCGAEREDATGVAIEKAIWCLRASGWLIQTSGEGRKRRLLVAWGTGMDGQARPWRFDRPDRGRPATVQVVAIPLALFDTYLGRLRLNARDPAAVDRYFERPLLDFDDIGVYASRQLGNIPVTPRLAQLGLVNDQGVVPPLPLDELLALAAGGQLITYATDGTTIAVRPSPAGEARLRKAGTLRSQSPCGEQDGSATDPAHLSNGSTDGSVDSESLLVSQSNKATVVNNSTLAWDRDGNNQLTKSDPSPTGCTRAQTAPGAGASPTLHELALNSAQPVSYQPSQAPEESAGACENNHSSLLDPLIVAGHQALNTERAIPAAEWWALLALQQQYGQNTVVSWQLRAAGAGRSEVRLAYYLVCATDAALRPSGGGKRQTEYRESVPPTPALQSSSADGFTSQRSTSEQAAPDRLLDRNRALLVAGIEQLTGRRARHPERLADVPLPRLACWREIAGHPGLQVWNDPLGYIIAEAAAGNEPPAREELNAWAKRAGVHWLDPQLRTLEDDVEEWEEWDDAGDACASLDAHAIRASRVTGALPDPTTALCEMLMEMLPRRYWPILDRLIIQVADDETHISCPNRVVYDAVWDMQGAIRDALLDLELPLELRITAPALARPALLHDVSLRHPDWIDATTWLALDSDLRSALLGSALTPDGGLDVRADMHALICTRFAAPVRDLLSAAQARASP
jgi:hypothetical protein